MGRFLRENWLWIVAPIVIVLVLMGVIVWLSESGEEAPFIYPIF